MIVVVVVLVVVVVVLLLLLVVVVVVVVVVVLVSCSCSCSSSGREVVSDGTNTSSSMAKKLPARSWLSAYHGTQNNHYCPYKHEDKACRRTMNGKPVSAKKLTKLQQGCIFCDFWRRHLPPCLLLILSPVSKHGVLW